MINSLTRYQPDLAFTRLPEMIDQLFRDSFVFPTRFGYFDVRRNSNLLETDNEYIVQLMLPGVDPKTLKIQVVGRQVSVTASIVIPKVEKAVFLVEGLVSQEFSEVFTLPVEVVGDKADAVYEYGILTIKMPKLESARPKMIEVHTTK